MEFNVKKLTVGYNHKALIKDISFDLKSGEILCLIGPNGSGKSTILHSITKHLSKLSGNMELDGVNTEKMKNNEFARNISVVLTEKISPDLMTVYDVVSMGRYPYTNSFGKLSREDEKIIDECMIKTDVAQYKDRMFQRLSDGQRQRVLLARALCQKPRIIVLDEPTSYLDIRYKLELLDILKMVSRNDHVGVILSLHEVELATSISDKVLLIKDNSIMAYGAPEDVLDDSAINELYDLKPGKHNTLECVNPGCRVFVISGGGTGAECFRALEKRRIAFTTGIMQKYDKDYSLALELSEKVYTSQEFMPPDKETVDKALKDIEASKCVIDTGMKLGIYNKECETLINYALDRGVPVLSLRQGANEVFNKEERFESITSLVGRTIQILDI